MVIWSLSVSKFMIVFEFVLFYDFSLSNEWKGESINIE